MARFRRASFILWQITVILIFPGILHNYNLTYLNWTYLTNPITSQVIYCFSNTYDCTQEVIAVQNAATTWNASGAAFAFPQIQEGPGGGFSGLVRDAMNQIGWKTPWPEEYGTNIALTETWYLVDSNKILEADTVFNDDKTWSTESTPPAGAYDVQSVMLHEFGHWLSLWHSACTQQGGIPIVMQPYVPSGQNGLRRNLAQDDKDGAKAIYNYLGWAGARITSNAGESNEPAIAVSMDDNSTKTIAEENYVHLVWSDNSTGKYKIYYKQHILGGNENVAWTPTIGLNSPSGISGSHGPHIAIAFVNNVFYVHVVWCDDSPGNNEIYYARSINGGSTFLAPVRLTQNQGDSIAPAIAVDGQRVYVVWMDNNPGLEVENPHNYEIFFRMGTDSGATWSTGEERLTYKSHLPAYTAFSGFPDIAAGSGLNRYVVWRDNRHYLPEGGVPEIYFKKFDGSTMSWGTDKRLTTSGGGGCYEPAIAVSKHDDAIHVVYEYQVPENLNGDIFYLKSTNHGSSFPYASRISTTDSMSGDAKISLGYVYQNSYILHVVWQEDYPAGEEVHYASNKSWESVWSSPQRISYNGTNCHVVSVSAFGYNIHLAWSQKVGSESDNEIHHRRNRARVE